jgi:hypothetical protein
MNNLTEKEEFMLWNSLLKLTKKAAFCILSRKLICFLFFAPGTSGNRLGD